MLDVHKTIYAIHAYYTPTAYIKTLCAAMLMNDAFMYSVHR